MTARTQQDRTPTNNTPPANNALLPGQLFVEMGTPLRLWTGVPTSIAPAGNKLILDASQYVTSFNTRVGPVTLTGADITSAGGALLASPVFTGDPQAPTPPAGDADTSVATTAFVAAAIAGIPRANYADNSGFSVNQRGYVSGTALTAAAYGHDRWKAGAGGCTYTFTAAPPSTTITIAAGTLQQVVEGASVAGGNYMLSWTGTAQGRVGAGAYAASPVALTGIAAGANTTIEFNAGTLGRVKLEAGTVVTPWPAKIARDELSNCQRFYQTGTAIMSLGAGGAGWGNQWFMPFPVQMRAAPTAAVVAGSPSYFNASGANVGPVNATGLAVGATTTAAGGWSAQFNFTASADL